MRDIERELEIQKNEAICLKSLKDFSFEDLKNEEDDDDEDDQDTNPLLSESSSFKKDVWAGVFLENSKKFQILSFLYVCIYFCIRISINIIIFLFRWRHSVTGYLS